MRISYKWLSDYVTLPPVDELARRLTAVGLEVEAIDRPGAALEGVVVARVLASEKHPNAEKLSVTRIDAGAGEPLQVVCGAKNYHVGDLVPLAKVGASLPGGMRISKAKLRGVESYGMLCSAKELGIEAESSGLLILPAEEKPGAPIAQALGLDDVLLEVNVTPNRPDALSHLGIAREVAAALGTQVKLPGPKLDESGAPASEAVRVRIDAPELCHRYAARVVEGVKIGPSPRWLAQRLEACGIRSISNVVDATNYVLLELGHPLHAFDLDKVAGSEIIVRTARPGEKMKTLDGKERALDPEDLVVGDRDRGSALAGVMGGGDSEIAAGTTRVLVESAWFLPRSIRRTARRHALQSEASYRFERGADPGMVRLALDRCASLIAELSGGRVRSGVVDVHPRPHQPGRVRLRWDRPSQVLGREVAREDARRILSSLGFEACESDAQSATWIVPSWRQDIAIEEELIEEIVRAQGYDAIPETLPPLALDTPALPPDAEAASRIRLGLEASGFNEAVNFSFVAPPEIAAFDPEAAPIALKNPISAELAVMRTSLIPSLLKNAALNLRQRVEDVRLYEIARCFSRAPGEEDAPAREWNAVAGVILGRRAPIGWSSPADRVDFFDAKGAVEGILEALGVKSARWQLQAPPWAHPRSGAVVSGRGDRPLGYVAELHPRVATAFELPRGVFAFELDLAAVLAQSQLVPRFGGVPRFPAVLRDLAVVVEDRVASAQVMAAVRREALVEEASLFDVYTGAPIPQGKKNLALALRYRAADRTLTDVEVDEAHQRIVDRLRTDPEIQAELRG